MFSLLSAFFLSVTPLTVQASDVVTFQQGNGIACKTLTQKYQVEAQEYPITLCIPEGSTLDFESLKPFLLQHIYSLQRYHFGDLKKLFAGANGSAIMFPVASLEIPRSIGDSLFNRKAEQEKFLKEALPLLKGLRQKNKNSPFFCSSETLKKENALKGWIQETLLKLQKPSSEIQKFIQKFGEESLENCLRVLRKIREDATLCSFVCHQAKNGFFSTRKNKNPKKDEESDLQAIEGKLYKKVKKPWIPGDNYIILDSPSPLNKTDPLREESLLFSEEDRASFKKAISFYLKNYFLPLDMKEKEVLQLLKFFKKEPEKDQQFFIELFNGDSSEQEKGASLRYFETDLIWSFGDQVFKNLQVSQVPQKFFHKLRTDLKIEHALLSPESLKEAVSKTLRNPQEKPNANDADVLFFIRYLIFQEEDELLFGEKINDLLKIQKDFSSYAP